MNSYTMFRCFLGLGLLLVGCGEDPSAATRPDDATGGAGGALVGDAGGGGSGGSDAGTGGASIKSDAGTGGSAQAGTGGEPGSGGAIGTGGVSGTGGNQGTGGTVADTACVDPMGWTIESPGGCYTTTNAILKKNGHACRINCRSVQPGGAVGNYIGPPFHPECITPAGSDFPGVMCVAACTECS